MPDAAELTPMSPAFDQARADAFVQKAMLDCVGQAVTTMAAIGDRLGLFKALAANGPATSAELADRAGVHERYVREWLAAMASAGYLAYDSASRRFELPPEHVPVLAEEAGPTFFGGAYQTLLGQLAVVDQIVEAFRAGGGVPPSAYPDAMFEGMERFSAPYFEHLLVQEWIRAAPEVRSMLEHGCRVADVGCGQGRALIKLAQAFPESRFVGFDLHGPNVTRATAHARAAGVADRLTFREADVAEGVSGQYDLITAFDVIHDAVDPRGLLREIRRVLNPAGVFLCLETRCADRLEQNAGPLGALFYSISVLYCLTTSLAGGGEALGTMGLPEPKLRELSLEAGFREVARLPIENPFNTLYAIRP